MDASTQSKKHVPVNNVPRGTYVLVVPQNQIEFDIEIQQDVKIVYVLVGSLLPYAPAGVKIILVRV